MLLKEWREKNEWSLARLAAELGVPGEYPAGTVQRWEIGKSRPEADVIDRIEKLTGGDVTATDMHEARLSWLNKQAAEAAA
jgi:transcriptional regulator with XRE-family HTH domain